MGTLKRRLKHFELRMIDRCITTGQIANAISEELVNSGEDLGFRAMTKKLREKHKLNVKQDDVLDAMHDLDPQGVERRGNIGMKVKVPRRTFISPVGAAFSYLKGVAFQMG